MGKWLRRQPHVFIFHQDYLAKVNKVKTWVLNIPRAEVAAKQGVQKTGILFTGLLKFKLIVKFIILVRLSGAVQTYPGTGNLKV